MNFCLEEKFKKQVKRMFLKQLLLKIYFKRYVIFLIFLFIFTETFLFMGSFICSFKGRISRRHFERLWILLVVLYLVTNLLVFIKIVNAFVKIFEFELNFRFHNKKQNFSKIIRRKPHKASSKTMDWVKLTIQLYMFNLGNYFWSIYIETFSKYKNTKI